jgi:hypothetical protein
MLEEAFKILPIIDKRPILEAKRIAEELEIRLRSAPEKLQRVEFHELVARFQDRLNREGILRAWVIAHEKQVAEVLGVDSLYWVSVMKLRVVRPKNLLSQGEQDNVPMHRESLYAGSDQVQYQYNCWIPLSRAATTSGMWYLPNSHRIPDSELRIVEDLNHPVRVERFSKGHAIGLPYKPKLICDPRLESKDSLSRFTVPAEHFLLFSAMLIHGGGENTSDATRFSMDTGCIPSSKLSKNTPLFAANGRNHYMSSGELS